MYEINCLKRLSKHLSLQNRYIDSKILWKSGQVLHVYEISVVNSNVNCTAMIEFYSNVSG